MRLIARFLAAILFVGANGASADPGWPGGIDVPALIQREFARYDPNYAQTRQQAALRLDALHEALRARERRGRSLPCSRQILIEARWAITNTAAWDRADRLLEHLAASLDERDQAFAANQSPTDGLWGVCYDEWFHRIDATTDALNARLAFGVPPTYPIQLNTSFGTPDALVAFLKSLLISDIATNGVVQRNALGVSLTALSQVMFKPALHEFVAENSVGLPIADDYARAYRRFLDEIQDPETGYWGAWFRVDGAIHKSADLSFTFHTISYRRGQVAYWPRIIETTFAIRDLQYPYGWLHRGKYNNHNNYDIAVILRYGWPHMTDDQRVRAIAAIEDMLQWTLQSSMDGDGGFADDPTFYTAAEDAVVYGISFLDTIGYWDKTRRFWTDRDFPEANAVACRVAGQLQRRTLSEPSARANLTRLRSAC